MRYSVEITRAAERDLNGTADYIDLVLLNPKAAVDLLDAVDKTVQSIQDFPETCPLADDPVLKSWGIRFAAIKNYLLFYAVSEEKHCVYLVRFLYGRRDWVTILRASVPPQETR